LELKKINGISVDDICLAYAELDRINFIKLIEMLIRHERCVKHLVKDSARAMTLAM
jgi:hypothetical protein